ncbi:zinc-binding dehydrogenase [Thermus sp.]|uniref:zinc-binding dehydrogenase n=1 Tax=Thermus sp. TaxID=275 RepID=UPI00307CE7E6
MLVLGAGSLGGLLAWLLRRAGAEVFLEDSNPSRVRYLVDLGLGWPAGDGLEEWDAALDTVGVEASLRRAVRAVVPGGRVVAVGLGALEAPLPLQELVLGERMVQGSYTFTPEDFVRATALTPEVPEDLVARYPLEAAPEVFRALLEGRIPTPKVVLEHGEV